MRTSHACRSAIMRLVLGACTLLPACRTELAPHRLADDAELLVVDTVRAGSVDVWAVRLTGLRPARLEVAAALLLTCRVFDPVGAPLEPRDETTCVREWTPARTGSYRVEIHNPHTEAVAYRLTSSSPAAPAAERHAAFAAD